MYKLQYQVKHYEPSTPIVINDVVYSTFEEALDALIGYVKNDYRNEWNIIDRNGQVIQHFLINNGYDINVLEGLTINKIDQSDDYRELIFYTNKGAFKMYHMQDCCEYVRLVDVCGDLHELVGSPVLSAYSTSNKSEDDDGSQTWTFYHIRTFNESVTLRWLGESNGWYSEGVDFDYIGG